MKDFGLITNTERSEVIDPSKISREKKRIGATSIIEREEDILHLECIGLDSKRDTNVPVILQKQEEGVVKVFKTKATVDHITFTAESGTVEITKGLICILSSVADPDPDPVGSVPILLALLDPDPYLYYIRIRIQHLNN